MRQAKLQEVCEVVVDDVESALGCAVVDLATGLPLALDVKPGSLLSATAMEFMSAAGVVYFRGHMGGSSDPEGADAANAVQEIQATTEDTYHFMSLVPGDGQELLILITERNSSNLGLGWMAMREALERVRSAEENGAASGLGDAEAAVAPSSQVAPQRPLRPNPDVMNTRSRSRRTIWGQR